VAGEEDMKREEGIGSIKAVRRPLKHDSGVRISGSSYCNVMLMEYTAFQIVSVRDSFNW
jgi:hypothetical protein